MKNKGNMISDWLDQNGNPEIEKFIEKNLAITEKVRLALESKGWSNLKLAEEMGKSPSEVSKWLTGMHNLTLKSIIKMEIALGIDLTHTEPVKEYKCVFVGVIKNQNLVAEKASDYQNTGDSLRYSIAM